MEVTNPYAAPKAPLADSAEQRYYTPGQVFLATVLGGPLAGGYLFSRNYSLFGLPTKAKAVLVWSVVILICGIALGYALPEHSGGTGIAATIAGMYRWYAKEAFEGKIAERQHLGWLQYSWWRVVAISVGFLVLVLVLLFALVFLLPRMLVGRSLVLSLPITH